MNEGAEQFYDALVFIDEYNWSDAMKDSYKNFSAKLEVTIDDEIPF